MSAEIVKLGYVRHEPKKEFVIQLLRHVADLLENDPEQAPGKVFVCTLKDHECPGGEDGEYTAHFYAHGLRNSETIALVEYTRLELALQMMGYRE